MGKGKRLEDMILRSRYKNINQFAKASGVPYTTIKSMIERDLHNASIDNVVKISKSLNVTVENLIGEDYKGVELSTSLYNYLPNTISAGLPLEVEGVTNADKIPIPDAIMGKWAGNNDVYISKINGDSMDKVMSDGTLIAIKPVGLDNLKNGDMVVFSKDYEYSVKYYYSQDDKLIFKPASNNPAHYDQQYNIDDNIEIHGIVVMYIVELD